METMQDLKIIVKLLKDRSHKIEIRPLLWVIIPNIRNFFNKGKDDLVDIYVKKYHQFKSQIVPRKIGRTYVIEWLCFSIHLGLWHTTEVGEIYPSGWDWNKRTAVENCTLLERLHITGYFND